MTSPIALARHCAMPRLLATLACFLIAALPAISPAQPFDPDALRRTLASPDRNVDDFIRDASRKPVEVLTFLGIETGMQVLDVYAAGGYYTFILARAVGPDGRVFAQNTPRGLNYEEDRQNITQGEALENKIRAGNLDNVTQLIARLEELPLAPASVDAILLAQVLHDYYNPDPVRARALLDQLFALLKPGGVVGVTDHVGIAGMDNRDLHRMQIDQAISLAEDAGFTVEQSDLLRNPQDDHRRNIFDPRLNRNTDRFLLKLSKPR